MSEKLPSWLGDIHQLVSAPWAILISIVAAIICGGLIGLEREKARKPAGFRTLLLICLGSVIFTQASIMTTGHRGDPSRIAAQIVTGIGFLGAGAIMRDHGTVAGLTTAASVWAVAAIGVMIGAGYVTLGVFFSLVVFLILTASGTVENSVRGKCKYKSLILDYEAAEGKTQLRVQSVLDSYQSNSSLFLVDLEIGLTRAKLQYCATHADHRIFLGELMEVPGLLRVSQD